ncbi:hypothetical protein COP00_02530 [Bacillus glycinifermentans]|nr:hypothetical protein COP00_02530 [Bacillus glycinifermentans]
MAFGSDKGGLCMIKNSDVVKRFQMMHGLSADGIYGTKTKAKLEALSKKIPFFLKGGHFSWF